MNLATQQTHPTQKGVALMEVLLALALFVAAAAVVTTALNASLSSLERQRLSVHGVNLASSVMAEIQLGIRPLAADSHKAFPIPFQEWTSEVLLSTADNGSGDGALDGQFAGQSERMAQVEVVVRHENPPSVQRLAQRVGRSGTGGINPIASPIAYPTTRP